MYYDNKTFKKTKNKKNSQHREKLRFSGILMTKVLISQTLVLSFMEQYEKQDFSGKCILGNNY